MRVGPRAASACLPDGTTRHDPPIRRARRAAAQRVPSMVHAGDPGHHPNSFPRALRLTSPGDYRFVFDKARVVRDDAFRILSRGNDLDHCRLGLAVSRKACRKAAGRNRIKRLVRESFRHNQHALSAAGPVDIVVLPTPGAATICNAELSRRLAALWNRMGARQAADADNENRKKH